jgi:ankyrin repeat protein
MSWQKEICNRIGGKLGVRIMEKHMVQALEEIIESGGEINEVWNRDLTYDEPVWASLLEDPEVPVSIIQYLFEHGAIIPKENKKSTPLLFTAAEYHNDPRVFEILIQNGADASYIAPGNETALQKACLRSEISVEVIQILFESGCPINIQKEDCGNSPLGNATLVGCSNEVIEYLIKAGADVDAEDIEGNTPVIRLCNNNFLCTDQLNTLINAGADLNHINNAGYTVLGELCRGEGDTDLLKALIDNGMGINTVEDGRTLPMIAMEMENVFLLEEILELGFSNFEARHPESNKTTAELITEFLTHVDGESYKTRIKKFLEQ